MKLIKGMDVSLAEQLESLGAVYSLNGRRSDLFQILHECGTNLVRLRLWVNPYDEEGTSYGGGLNDIATTINLARRVRKAHMKFMLDIHYSDFWADPAKQIKPKAWKNLTGDALVTQVHEYTKRVLLTLNDVDLLPSYVQIGNEITNGLLWPDGKSDRVERMAQILRAGIQAAREIDAGIKIVIHLDFGTDNKLYREWFSAIAPYHLDFDIIGMSYYPHWNGSISQLKANMDDVSALFKKDVLVTETSIGYTTDNLGCQGIVFTPEQEKSAGYPATKEGQAAFLKDLFQAVQNVRDHHGLGVIYWEPAWLPIPECTWASKAGRLYLNDAMESGNSNANQALFDAHGNANPALLELKTMGSVKETSAKF